MISFCRFRVDVLARVQYITLGDDVARLNSLGENMLFNLPTENSVCAYPIAAYRYGSRNKVMLLIGDRLCYEHLKP